MMDPNEDHAQQLAPDACYQPAHPRIIYQRHEDETLILNLDFGYYYCLEGAAPLIWEMATSGASLSQMINVLNERAAATVPPNFGEEVSDFIQQLLSENLLIPVDVSNTPSEPDLLEDRDIPDTLLLPTLCKFTDLAELLLADPIHEIDSLG